jgi:hypothetical protein
MFSRAATLRVGDILIHLAVGSILIDEGANVHFLLSLLYMAAQATLK